MSKDRLDDHLKNIASALGGSGTPTTEDKLDWYLNNITSLIEGGGGSAIQLKTINGQDLQGEGNIEITTYQAFPADWASYTTSTTKTIDFCKHIDTDDTATIGMGYFGGASFKDKPAGLSNFDVVVEILAGPKQNGVATKAIHLIGTSSNIYPYRWEYTFWSHTHESGWRGVQPELTTSSITDGTPTTVIGFDSQGSLVKANTPSVKMYSHMVIMTNNIIRLILPFADSIENHKASMVQGIVGTRLHFETYEPTLGLGWIFWNVDEWSLWDVTGTEIAYSETCNDVITELE